MSSHRRGPWSQAEDSFLTQLVQTQGALNWVRIAQLIGSRTPKQCRERYHQNLKPSLSHDPISPEEGLQIERMVGEMGKRWAEIARRLKGRSDNDVKNWWNGSMNRRSRLVYAQDKLTSLVYTPPPPNMNTNHNTQFAIKSPNDYSTTHLPTLWPRDALLEATLRGEINKNSGELSASTNTNDPPKYIATRPGQLPLPPLRQYLRTSWDGAQISVDINDKAIAESHEDLYDDFTVFSKDSGYKSAKSIPNSNATTSKRSQPVFRNIQNRTNDSQPLGAGQTEEFRKALSDTSHDSGFSGATLSSLGGTEVKGTPEELAEILANHPEFRPLIIQATKEMDPRRFEKVFIRLLKTCAIDLRGEAKTPLEKGAVRIIYNYRAYATSLIRDEFTNRGHEKVSAMNKLKFQKVTQSYSNPFTPDLIEENALMSDRGGGGPSTPAGNERGNNTGSSRQAAAGTTRSHTIRGPREIMRERQARKKAEQEQQELERQRAEDEACQIKETNRRSIERRAAAGAAARVEGQRGSGRTTGQRISDNSQRSQRSQLHGIGISREALSRVSSFPHAFERWEDKMKLDMVIENYQQNSTEKQDIQMNEDDEEEDKLSIGSDYNDLDEPDLRNLRKVRGFITSSIAFSNLKSNLEDFLTPPSDGNKPATVTLQTGMDDIQLHPATADRSSSKKRKSAENEEDMTRQVKWPRLDESSHEKNPLTLDAEGEDANIECDTFGPKSPVIRPSDSSVDIEVIMEDLDIEHEAERQLQEIGHSNSNDHCSSSKHLKNQSIFNSEPVPKRHPLPSETPVLTTSHHSSWKEDTVNELCDMIVRGAPSLSTLSKGEGKPAFLDDVNVESPRVLQMDTEFGSSSMGARSLNNDSLSQTEDENCSLQGSALQDPAKTNIDGQLTQHRPSSSTSQKIWGMLKRRWRPSLQPGHKRLDWVCGCGEDLYADLQDDGGVALTKLAAILTCPITETPYSNPNFQAQSPTPMQAVHHSSFSIPRAHNSRHSPARSLLNQSDINHISQGPLQPPLNATPPKSPHFLELCVNSGEYLKVLGEIPTGNISSDQELFQSIKKKYLELRGFRARFWLLKPSAVNYVHISVENCHRVGILEKPLALPPKDEVDAKRYIYDPCPLVGGVPIPDHIFLHYMNCTNPLSKDAWLGRLPKKLDTSITHNAPAITYGWGVHIDEGPNYGAIAWMNFFVLLLSGVAAVLWNLYKKDFQGAFGFSCWIIAVLNSLMVGYFFRWKSE